MIWDRRLKGGAAVPGLPAAMTGPTASRISAIALVVSTVALGGVLALLLGAWALVALPPLALSLASAWLMARTPRSLNDAPPAPARPGAGGGSRCPGGDGSAAEAAAERLHVGDVLLGVVVHAARAHGG